MIEVISLGDVYIQVEVSMPTHDSLPMIAFTGMRLSRVGRNLAHLKEGLSLGTITTTSTVSYRTAQSLLVAFACTPRVDL